MYLSRFLILTKNNTMASVLRVAVYSHVSLIFMFHALFYWANYQLSSLKWFMDVCLSFFFFFFLNLYHFIHIVSRTLTANILHLFLILRINGFQRFYYKSLPFNYKFGKDCRTHFKKLYFIRWLKATRRIFFPLGRHNNTHDYFAN